MKYITKLKLASIHQLCNHEDKSTEYMLQLMQDVCNVSLDTVINYMKLDDKIHQELFNELNSLLDILIKLDN